MHHNGRIKLLPEARCTVGVPAWYACKTRVLASDACGARVDVTSRLSCVTDSIARAFHMRSRLALRYGAAGETAGFGGQQQTGVFLGVARGHSTIEDATLVRVRSMKQRLYHRRTLSLAVVCAPGPISFLFLFPARPCIVQSAA
jgi:hypothetical protein